MSAGNVRSLPGHKSLPNHRKATAKWLRCISDQGLMKLEGPFGTWRRQNAGRVKGYGQEQSLPKVESGVRSWSTQFILFTALPVWPTASKVFWHRKTFWHQKLLQHVHNQSFDSKHLNQNIWIKRLQTRSQARLFVQKFWNGNEMENP